MSRVINSDSPGQNRNRLLKLVAKTISLINQNNFFTNELNDQVAFIILSLTEIERTITLTTTPWEKREYWVKADQFRREWKWVGEMKTKLIESRTEKGWKKIPPEISSLEERLKIVSPSKRLQGKDFCKGAYSVLIGEK
jgi:hypothetical protein